MGVLSASDKLTVDLAWEMLMRQIFGKNPFSWKLSALIEQGTDTNPTFGNVTALSLTTNGGGAELAVGANATIGGTLGITGAATVGGTLGVTGVLTSGGNLLPGTSNALTLGDGAHAWNDLYVNRVHSGNLVNANITWGSSVAGGTTTLQSDVVDGGVAISVILNATRTLANGTARLVSVQNNSIEKAWIGVNGDIHSSSGYVGISASMSSYLQAPAVYGSGNTLLVSGQVADGATAVGVAIDNTVSLVTGGSKILSVRNNGVERWYVDAGGNIISGSGFNAGGNVNAGTYVQAPNYYGSGTHINLNGQAADGSSAIAVVLNNQNTLSTAGAKLVSIRNNTAEKASFDLNGKLVQSYGDVTGANAGAGGDATSNTVTGRGAIASGASSCTITDANVSSTSVVLVQLESTGVGIDSLSVAVNGSGGSFVVTSLSGLGITTVTGAKTQFSWIVMS